MSKLETPLTERYWKSVGGSLVHEFRAVQKTASQGQRLIDGVIIMDGQTRTAHWRDVSLEGFNVISVQTKANRLGMYLLGQALFSAELLKTFKPKSIRTVAICTRGDTSLDPLARKYEIEVVVCSN